MLQDLGPRGGPADLPGAHCAIARIRIGRHSKPEADDTENDHCKDELDASSPGC